MSRARWLTLAFIVAGLLDHAAGSRPVVASDSTADVGGAAVDRALLQINDASAGSNGTMSRRRLTGWSNGEAIAFRSGRTGLICSNDGSWGLNCNKEVDGQWETFTAVTAPGGPNMFALRSQRTQKFCCDDPSGFVCNRDAIGTWETFERVSIAGSGPNVFALRSRRTNRFCSDARPFTCNRDNIGPWETFSRVGWSNGEAIAFRSGRTGLICSNDGSWGLNCNREGVGSWETFTAVIAPGGPNLFALRSQRTQKFCCDDPSGFVCNRDAIGPWETFERVSIAGSGPDAFALRSRRTNRFCGDARPFTCKMDNIGAWETFSRVGITRWPIWVGNAQAGTTFNMPSGVASTNPSSPTWLDVNGCNFMDGAQYVRQINAACNAHDICYLCAGTPGWGLSQDVCDNLVYSNTQRICEGLYGRCEWYHFGMGDACWCVGIIPIMKAALDVAGHRYMINENCLTNGKDIPYEYATKPFWAGFPASSCNSHPC